MMTDTLTQSTFVDTEEVVDGIAFTVSQPDLVNVLALAARVSSRKVTTLPIIKYVLLDTRDGALTISATDLDSWITIPVHTAKSINKGATTVSASDLLSLAKGLDAKAMVRLAFDKQHVNKSRITITSGNTVIHLPTLPVEDFPGLQYQTGTAWTLDAGDMREAVRHTVFATGEQQDRAITLGVGLSLSGGALTATGFDGFRLAIYNWKEDDPDEQDPFSCIVPTTSSRMIYDLIQNEDRILWTLGNNQLSINIPEGPIYTTRLIEGIPIDPAAIYPATFAHKVIVNRKEFLAAVRRAAHFGQTDNRLISLMIGDDIITISTDNQMDGASFDVLPDVVITGSPITIIIDALKFQGVVDMLPGETITLSANGPTEMVSITDPTLPEFRFVVVPITKG